MAVTCDPSADHWNGSGSDLDGPFLPDDLLDGKPGAIPAQADI